MGKVNEVLQEILNVNWEYREDRKRSHIILFMEFLRRNIPFLQELDKPDKYICINLPSLIVSELDDLYATYRVILNHLKEQWYHPVFGGILHMAVRWAYIEEYELSELVYKYPNPYEAILWLYKRGGHLEPITKHGIGIIVPGQPVGYSFTRHELYGMNHPEPFIELSDEALDAFDALPYHRDNYENFYSTYNKNLPF